MFEFVENLGRFPQVPRLRELGLLVVCAREILRCAQDDQPPGCHPERSEGSRARMGITSVKCLDNPSFPCYHSAN